MKRSRVIGAIAAALVAGLVLGGVGISLAGPRTATPVPNAATAAPANTIVVPAATTAVARQSSNAATVAPAPRARRATVRVSSPTARHQTSTRATTRRTTMTSGSRYYCEPHSAQHHGSSGGCW